MSERYSRVVGAFDLTLMANSSTVVTLRNSRWVSSGISSALRNPQWTPLASMCTLKWARLAAQRHSHTSN